ncbi:MAG: hypothetical protein K0S48_1224 [Ramlibacter sp.]|nr:hypothetical protein [Ramlibacter sp.]
MQLSPSQVIVLATPVFLLLIAVELAWGVLRKRNTYRLNDAINSLSLGMLSQISAVLTRLFRVGIYTAVFSSLALWRNDAFWMSPVGWLLALVDLLYQFWVHTEHVGKLGWFDRWFCSPSNHRVHHAVNDSYLDRNYGGILVIWDRMFGSFREEDEKCVYGTRAPLQSWDPLWSNFEVYWALAKDSWHARSWADKLRVWIKPPGWRPADVAARFPRPAFSMEGVTRYHPPMTPSMAWFAGLQFTVILGGVALFLWHADQMPLRQSVVWLAVLAASLWAIGAAMQGRIGMLEVLLIEAGALATASAAQGWIDLHRVFKPLAMVLAIVFVLQRSGWLRAAGRFEFKLLAALALCLAGDVLLMLEGLFIPGLVSFLAAHLCYLALFKQGQRWFPSGRALAATLAAAVAMVAFLFPHLGPVLKVAVAAYAVVIALMAAQAIGRAVVLRDAASVAVAAGSVVFMLSDTLLAINRFAQPLPMAQFWVLATYYAAQVLIVRNARPTAAAYLSVDQFHQPVAPQPQPRIVRDDHERSAALTVDAPQVREDFVGGRAVEVARGFVGQHERGLEDEGPGDGHPLLHAAGQLRGFLVHGRREPHRGQQLARAFALGASHAAIAHQDRQGHVLQRAEGRQQVVELEHEPQRAPAAQRELRVVQRVHLLAQQAVAARRHGFQQPEDVQQRALAGAGRPHQRGELAAGDAQLQPVQHLGFVRPAQVVALANTGQGDQLGLHIRIACAGSIAAARRAGMIAASTPQATASRPSCNASPQGRSITNSGWPSLPRTNCVNRKIMPVASSRPSTAPKAPTTAPCSRNSRITCPRVAPIARRMPISRRFCTTDTTSTLAMPSTTTTTTTTRMIMVLMDCALSAVTSCTLLSCQLSTL